MLSSRQSYTCALQGSYFVAHGGVYDLNCPDVEETNEMNRGPSSSAFKMQHVSFRR